MSQRMRFYSTPHEYERASVPDAEFQPGDAPAGTEPTEADALAGADAAQVVSPDAVVVDDAPGAAQAGADEASVGEDAPAEDDQSDDTDAADTDEDDAKPAKDVPPVKRKRGRPRKSA